VLPRFRLRQAYGATGSEADPVGTVESVASLTRPMRSDRGGEPLLCSPTLRLEIRSIARYGRRTSQQAAPGNGQAICNSADRASTIPGTNALDKSIALGHSGSRLFNPFFGNARSLDLNSRGRVDERQSGSPCVPTESASLPVAP
jgi:hypothetical protein